MKSSERAVRRNDADETGAAAATHTHTDRRGLETRAETLEILLLEPGTWLCGRL